MSTEGNPEANKPAFVSPEKKVVTNRTYEEYLKQFQLPEDELRSKRILDVGSGLSDFSKEGNERLKESGTMIVALDPTYAFLPESSSIDGYAEKLGPTNLGLKNTSKSSQTFADRFEAVKNTPFKVAGSHQHLPFAKGSFDLALAHNSVLQFKDREITSRALHEIIEALTENGEIRILPSDLRWDGEAESFYMATFEDPTPASLDEARMLNLRIAPDRIIFDIFKELEDQGYAIYARRVEQDIPVGQKRLRMFLGKDTGPTYSLIIRKDSTLPAVNNPTSGFYKLDFGKSPDGYHIPSEEVLSEKEKATWIQERTEKQRTKELEEQRRAKIALDEDNARMPDELKSSALNELAMLEVSFTERMKELSRILNDQKRKGESPRPEEQQERSQRSAVLGEVRAMFEEASRIAGGTSRSAMTIEGVRYIKDADALAQIAEIYRDVRKKLESIPS